MCACVCVCCTVCVLIMSLAASDGCCNDYTSLHHQYMSAMSAEGSQSGTQKKEIWRQRGKKDVINKTVGAGWKDKR